MPELRAIYLGYQFTEYYFALTPTEHLLCVTLRDVRPTREPPLPVLSKRSASKGVLCVKALAAFIEETSITGYWVLAPAFPPLPHPPTCCKY